MWPFRRTGPSGFSSSSTAEDVTKGIDGSGLTAIVTGPGLCGSCVCFYVSVCFFGFVRRVVTLLDCFSRDSNFVKSLRDRMFMVLAAVFL